MSQPPPDAARCGAEHAGIFVAPNLQPFSTWQHVEKIVAQIVGIFGAKNKLVTKKCLA
jgi:hypothetical protein